MNDTIRNALATGIWPALLLMACVATAGEPGEVRGEAVNATGACNGALPGFEGALRKRALAIANESGAAAFVNCSVRSEGDVNAGYISATATFVNRSAVAATVNCTLVGGLAAEVGAILDLAPPTFRPRSVTVPAGAGALIEWDIAEFDVPSLGELINFSCVLSPKVEIATVGGVYQFFAPTQ